MPVSHIHIRPPATPGEFERYYQLRWRILRQPWQQPPGSERDELETSACHAMAVTDSGEVVGVARLHTLSPTQAQIRYMAVHADHRQQGIGTALLQYLEARARQDGITLVRLDARKDFAAFYEKQGYRCLGPGHTLFGRIEHLRMEKNL